MSANPSTTRILLSTTTIVRAGIICRADLSRLGSLAYDTKQAEELAYMLAVVADDEVEIVHVDERGRRHHFFSSPAKPVPLSRTSRGFVVSAELV